jgi:hypothetical protein
MEDAGWIFNYHIVGPEGPAGPGGTGVSISAPLVAGISQLQRPLWIRRVLVRAQEGQLKAPHRISR